MTNVNTIKTNRNLSELFQIFQGSNGYSDILINETKPEEDSKSFYGLTKEIIYGKLLEILENCNMDDWDGYGAKPITKLKKERAEKLALLFDSSIIIPRVIPEPSGEIGFEWMKGNKRFVLTFDEDFLVYSEIDGPKNNFGRLPSNNFAYLPQEIIEKLQRNFSLG